jgi:SAM-dependent methyltransferase
MAPPERPKVHPADWTPERIEAFWDNYSRTPSLAGNYFSANHGEGICEALERFVPLDGPVLDYGCGRGDLLALLLERGRTVMGCDSSSESAAGTNARLQGKPGFLGAFQSGGEPPRQPSVITLIEVVEHLPPPALPGFLRKVAALLAPGGHLVTTSPHREVLAAQEALCPECACLFHISQHLASIDEASMRKAAQEAGLTLVRAQPTLLRKSGDRSLRTALRRQAVELLRSGSAPHLVCVLRKQ